MCFNIVLKCRVLCINMVKFSKNYAETLHFLSDSESLIGQTNVEMLNSLTVALTELQLAVSYMKNQTDIVFKIINELVQMLPIHFYLRFRILRINQDSLNTCV